MRRRLSDLPKKLSWRPIYDLPGLPIPPTDQPDGRGTTDIIGKSLPGRGFQSDLYHDSAKLSFGGDLHHAIVHPDRTVFLEELIHLVTKGSKPRHFLSIEEFQKVTGIIGFKSLADIVESVSGIGLTECGTRARIRRSTLWAILTTSRNG
jgi:hypothetical protein